MKRFGFPAWWLIPAGLTRLACMAIGFHGDLYSIYWRAHQAVYHGDTIVHNQLLAHIVHVVWLWMLKIFHLIPREIWLYPFDYETGWRLLAMHPHAPVLLVLLKLPYLVVEILCFFVLLKIIPAASRRSVALFWLANPLILYGVHLYGRYESFPVLFVLLMFLALKRGRPVLGFASLVASVMVRLYTCALIPLYLWLVPRNRRQGVSMGLFLVIPFAGVLLYQFLTAGSFALFRDNAEVISLLTMPHRVFLFAAYIPLLQADVIYLFPLSMILIYLAAIDAKRPISADGMWRWGAWMTYLLFALTYFHPQWSVWLVPYLAIQRVSRRRVFYLTWIMAICLLFYTFQFDREASVLLFAPLGPASFDTWTHPMEILDRLRMGGVVVGLFRTLFTGCLIHLGWLARRDRPLVDSVAA